MSDLVRKAGNGAVAAGGGALVIGLIVAAFTVGPWLLFWSVGELTGMVIPFTFKTWLAAVVFLWLVRGSGGSSK